MRKTIARLGIAGLAVGGMITTMAVSSPVQAVVTCSGAPSGSTLPPLLTGSDGHVTIAHRGNSAEAPENTAPAITSAAAVGADYAEIDVRNTADNATVLMHDGSLRRTTNVHQVFPNRITDPINSFTLAELRQTDAGSWNDDAYIGVKPPSLRDAFLAADAADIGLFIEFKIGGNAFIDRVLDRVQLHPQVPVAFGAISANTACAVAKRMDARGMSEPLAVLAKKPASLTSAEIAAFGSFANVLATSPDVLTAADRNKVAAAAPHMQVVHNTSTRSAMEDSIANGADATMTDYPQRNVEVVNGVNVVTREAETMTARVSSGASIRTRPTGSFMVGGKLSGLGADTWRQIYNAGVGDWIEFDVNVPATDSYEVRAVVIKGHYTGSFKALLDGAQVHGPFDGYRPGTYRFARETMSLGTHLLSQGTHQLKFQVTAMGPHGDARVSVDVVELVAQ